MSHMLVRVAKWAWIGVVLVAAGFVFFHYWPQMRDGLARMSGWLIAASLLLTVLAKLVLGENARLAAGRCGLDLSYPVAIRLYNLSQLGKYIPGSIWQFVGRAAAYRQRGAKFANIRDSLLLESLWVVGSALALGLVLAGSRAVTFLSRQSAAPVLYWFAGLVLLAALCLLAGMIWKRHVLVRYIRLLVPSPRLSIVLLLTWALLGAAFWVLIAAVGIHVGLIYAIGLFALAFALGFLVPIAPAGLGVRDGVLAVGLLPYGPLEDALAVMVVARLVYLLVEVGLVGAQELMVALAARGRVSDGSA
jgi:uncharacterized membrane protein YbhN (UPF0104 family)